MIAWCCSAITNGNFEGKKRVYYRPWSVQGMPVGTLGGEGQRDRVGLGFCFYWCRRWGPWAHSLLVNLKHKSRNLKWRGKKKWPKLYQQISLKQRGLRGEGGLDFIWSRAGRPCVYPRQLSLKWMPQQSKLKPGTYIAKRITLCQGFHYNSSHVCADAGVNRPSGLPVLNKSVDIQLQ